MDGDLANCSEVSIRQDFVCDLNLKRGMVVVYVAVLGHGVGAVSHEVVEIAIERAEVRVAHGPASSCLGGENCWPRRAVPYTETSLLLLTFKYLRHI